MTKKIINGVKRDIEPLANLRSADLYGANLRSADLYGADLYGAILAPEEVIDSIIAQAIRSDGYHFFLFKLQDERSRVIAGCRDFSPEEYEHEQHIVNEYNATPKAKETRDILAFFRARLEGGK